MSSAEKTALRILREWVVNNEIPADKGSATVALSYDNYVKEADRQLSNSYYYCPLPKDPTSPFTTEINQFLLDPKN